MVHKNLNDKENIMELSKAIAVDKIFFETTELTSR